MRLAPAGWVWFSFPLEGGGSETVCLEAVMHAAHDALDEAEASGERDRLGPVLHWAHILKAEQDDEGDWPARVNARTGAAVGPARTRAPVALMERLEGILRSTEFAECIARAEHPRPEGADYP